MVASTPATERDESVVERLISNSAARTEVVLSVGRVLFCCILLVRFFVVGSPAMEGGAQRVLLVIPATVATVVLSAVIAWRAHRRRLSQRWLVVSVSLDAIGSFLGLASDVLWPWETYLGLLRIPDAAMIPVVVVAAGLRHSFTAALVGSVLNAISFMTLVGLDWLRNPTRAHYGWSEVSLFSMYVAGGVVIALAIAFRTRRLAERAADESAKAETARYSLALVLQDHHDVRSLLSSARLNAGLVRRAVPEQRSAVTASVALERDLTELSELVAGTRELAYAELAAVAEPVPVDVIPSIHATLSALARRFPAVDLRLERTANTFPVCIVGGERGLERIFLNLIVNACEGDGTAHARSVSVRVDGANGRVRLEIADDGPGFSAQTLATHPARVRSEKPNGSGLGLFLVHRIVEASGGTMRIGNLERGASIVIELPGNTVH